MRVLLDSCVWGGARDVVAGAGHDVQWVGGWEGDPGDAAIMAEAHTENRVLVPLDKDFGELAIVKGRIRTAPRPESAEGPRQFVPSRAFAAVVGMAECSSNFYELVGPVKPRRHDSRLAGDGG